MERRAAFSICWQNRRDVLARQNHHLTGALRGENLFCVRKIVQCFREQQFALDRSTCSQLLIDALSGLPDITRLESPEGYARGASHDCRTVQLGGVALLGAVHLA